MGEEVGEKGVKRKREPEKGERARKKVLKDHTWLGNTKRVMEIYDNTRPDL